MRVLHGRARLGRKWSIWAYGHSWEAVGRRRVGRELGTREIAEHLWFLRAKKPFLISGNLSISRVCLHGWLKVVAFNLIRV